MEKFWYFLLIISLLGCARLNPKGTVTRTSTGVILDLNTEGKITYKEGDMETSMDTRSSSLLKTLVEGAIVQGLDVKK